MTYRSARMSRVIQRKPANYDFTCFAADELEQQLTRVLICEFNPASRIAETATKLVRLLVFRFKNENDRRVQ